MEVILPYALLIVCILVLLIFLALTGVSLLNKFHSECEAIELLRRSYEADLSKCPKERLAKNLEFKVKRDVFIEGQLKEKKPLELKESRST